MITVDQWNNDRFFELLFLLGDGEEARKEVNFVNLIVHCHDI